MDEWISVGGTRPSWLGAPRAPTASAAPAPTYVQPQRRSGGGGFNLFNFLFGGGSQRGGLVTDPRWGRVGSTFAQGVSEGMYFGAQAWSPVVSGQYYQASLQQIADSYGQHSALMAQLQQQAAQSAAAIAQTTPPTVVALDNPVFSIPNIAQARAAAAARAGPTGTSRLVQVGAVAAVAFIGYRVWKRTRRQR